MEHYGIFSLLPPILAIIMAFTTKQVLLSLFAGVWIGSTMISGWNPLLGLINVFQKYLIPTMGDSWNASVLLFLLMIGSFCALIERGGGVTAFSVYLKGKIKTRRQAQVLTWIGGILVFFSDSANPVLIGPLFRPITDFVKVSREKLAYIVDSTSSPVPILIPFTAWGVYIMGIVNKQFELIGYNGNAFNTFVQAIPYQYYAWGAIIAVLIFAVTGFDYGPMKKAEKRAYEEGKVFSDTAKPLKPAVNIEIPEGAEPTIWNVLCPIIVLLVSIITMFLWTGGFPEVSAIKALGQANSMVSLICSFFIASVVASIFTVKSKVFNFKKVLSTWELGMEQMVVTVILMIFAWSIGGVCKDVGTSTYIVGITKGVLTPVTMLVVIFLAACITSFATGSSWGPIAIYLPISIPLAVTIGVPMGAAVGVVLSGALFGDHCSPISDTTVISSMGSSCDHIDHANTQLPYAITVALAACIGYIIVGITSTPVVGFVVTMACLLALIYALHLINNKKEVIVSSNMSVDE